MVHPTSVSSLALILGCCIAVASPAAEPAGPHSPSITNSLGMRFVWIPIADDHPKDSVLESLSTSLNFADGYHLGVCEVTQRQFELVMKRNPSTFSAKNGAVSRVADLDTSRLPVDSVTWFDAVKFCEALSALPAERTAGRSYRLPTSAEWEYASRAGSAETWCFGEDRSKLEQYAWFGYELCGRRPHAVGQKEANDFGLFDMYGNVWEWCQDQAPSPSANDSQETSPSRVICGGGWMSLPNRCSSVFQQSDPPVVADADSGFRVVLIRSQPSP